MIYFSSHKNRLVTKCDCCREKFIEGYEGETDRMEMTCRILKDAGWLQRNVKGRWLQICPECKEEMIKESRKLSLERLRNE